MMTNINTHPAQSRYNIYSLFFTFPCAYTCKEQLLVSVIISKLELSNNAQNFQNFLRFSSAAQVTYLVPRSAWKGNLI